MTRRKLWDPDLHMGVVAYADFDPPPRKRPPLFWLYEAGKVPGEHATAMRCRNRITCRS